MSKVLNNLAKNCKLPENKSKLATINYVNEHPDTFLFYLIKKIVFNCSARDLAIRSIQVNIDIYFSIQVL